MTGLADQLSPDDELRPWREWLSRHFPHYTTAPFADRHIRFWEWVTGLQTGNRPRPRVEVWPRGGAKSTTIELGCAYLGAAPAPRRHYVLYVSETQAQANKHVQAIAAMLERVGVRRALNEYGASKGWRHEEIRTANGFNCTAFGLDAGMRGVKLDEYRPDVIVFDDVDGRHDTPATTQKKIDVITETVLPAGSVDCAVIVIQNKIHADSIVSQLCDGKADFLHDREPAVVEPAVVDLEYEQVPQDDGTRRFVITYGTATWAGQDLATCEQQLNDWGESAFLREAQHEVDINENGAFKPWWWRYWQPRGANLPPVTVRMPDGSTQYQPAVELPEWWTQSAQSWDMTFKKTVSGSFVVGLVAGTNGPNGYLLDCFRERVDFVGSVDAVLGMTYKWPTVAAKLIEDKANGPAVVSELSDRVSGLVEWPVEGSKEARAFAATARVRSGNWYLPHPQLEGAGWVPAFIRELAVFPAAGEPNDQVDAFSQVDNYLLGMAVPIVVPASMEQRNTWDLGGE